MRNYKLLTEPIQQGTFDAHDALFKAVFDEAPDAIFLLHPGSFEIMECNTKALQLFQALDKNELKGRESFSLYDSEPVEFSKISLIETITRGMEHSLELAFRSLKGNIFWGRASLRKVEVRNGSLIIFRVRRVVDYMKTAEMLSSMVKVTSRITGMEFFCALTELLSKNFGVTTAMVAKIDPKLNKAISVCCWHKTGYLGKLDFNLDTSSSQNVLKGYTTFYPTKLREMFPDDQLVKTLEVDGYMGTPVFNASGEVYGLVILMDEKAMEEIPNSRHILSLFASRCGAEFERIETEDNYRKQIRELEGKIGNQ